MLRRRCLGWLASLCPAGLPLRAYGRTRGPDHYFDAPADNEMAVAVANGDLATIRCLVAGGQVDVFTVGRDATNWPVIAIAARRKGALDTLLELGALGDPRGKAAGQAMYAATLLADLSWLRRLHAAGASLDNRGGGSLLLEAAMNTRNRAVLDFYLENGADLEGRTTAGVRSHSLPATCTDSTWCTSSWTAARRPG